jgi:hypothetical protein
MSFYTTTRQMLSHLFFLLFQALRDYSVKGRAVRENMGEAPTPLHRHHDDSTPACALPDKGNLNKSFCFQMRAPYSRCA